MMSNINLCTSPSGTERFLFTLSIKVILYLVTYFALICCNEHIIYCWYKMLLKRNKVRCNSAKISCSVKRHNLKGILPMIWSFNSYLLLLFWKRKELRFETSPICFYFEQQPHIYCLVPKRKTCNFRFDGEVFCFQKSETQFEWIEFVGLIFYSIFHFWS